MVSTILFGWKSTKSLWEKNKTKQNQQKEPTDSNTAPPKKTQTSERIKNTALFMYFSSKTHQIEKCNKEMSVSEDGSWKQNVK